MNLVLVIEVDVAERPLTYDAANFPRRFDSLTSSTGNQLLRALHCSNSDELSRHRTILQDSGHPGRFPDLRSA